MVYLISDIHGGESLSGIKTCLSVCKQEDLVIILGDIGLMFRRNEENLAFTEWFLGLDINIAFVDGNHENFDYLQTFPRDIWGGGTVSRLSPKIVWLHRGEIYDICGKKFFVMGGCRSSAKWKQQGLWWPQEDPTTEELQKAYTNLEAAGRKVDYVLTHKYFMPNGDSTEELQALNRFIDREVSFKHWYAGHKHVHSVLDDKHTLVYDQPVRLAL